MTRWRPRWRNRFIPVDVAMEHQIIDADAKAFLAAAHRTLRETHRLANAVAFGDDHPRTVDADAFYDAMLVRTPHGGRP
jgi:hypothetical protein